MFMKLAVAEETDKVLKGRNTLSKINHYRLTINYSKRLIKDNTIQTMEYQLCGVPTRTVR